MIATTLSERAIWWMYATNMPRLSNTRHSASVIESLGTNAGL